MDNNALYSIKQNPYFGWLTMVVSEVLTYTYAFLKSFEEKSDGVDEYFKYQIVVKIMIILDGSIELFSKSSIVVDLIIYICDNTIVRYTYYFRSCLCYEI